MTATQTLERVRIEPLPKFTRIVRSRESFARRNGDGFAHRINASFDRLMLQSGVQIAPGVVLRLCLLGAIACGGSVFVAYENLLLTAVAVELGASLPIAVLMVIRSQRQARMLLQMPEMIEGLAAAAHDGGGILELLQWAVAKGPQPLADEMAFALRRMEMGLPVDEALLDLGDRTGLTSLGLLASAISLCHRTGGNLVWVLNRVAKTSREQLAVWERLRAVSIARKTSAALAIIPSSLVLGSFAWGPADRFAAPATGSLKVVLSGLVLILLGSYFVLTLLKNSQRS
jgi:tight adherence protein B